MTGGARSSRAVRWTCGAVLLLALAGCDDAAAVTPPPVGPGTTITGNYLAARHARIGGDEGDAATFLLAALRKAPDDPILLGRSWLVLTLDGRVGEAVDIARRYLKVEDDGVPLAHIVVATGDIRTGRFVPAIERLGSAGQSPLTAVLVPVLQAWAEFGAGHRDRAEAALDKLRGSPATTLLADVHAAWMADAAGDEVAAVGYVRAALKAQPEPWLRLAVLAGGILQRAGHKDEAQAVYDAYLQQHPGSELLNPALARLKSGKPPPRDITDARAGAAEALFDGAGIVGRQNNRDTALALGQLGLYLRPDFPPLQILVADMLENDDRFEDAIRVYQAIDAKDPLAVSARLGVARNLDRLDRFDEAQATLRQLAAEHPDDPEPYGELGDLLRRHDRFADAAVAYDQAVARSGTLEPRHWQLLYARGIALERSKQWPRAEADFLKALELEPNQPFVLNYLGYSWVEQGQNLDKAEAMIRKAVELEPNDGYIIDSLGWVLFRLGRHDEAVVQLERAVEIRPEDPAINDHLGDAYWAVGRQREARFQWEAALVNKPEPELKTAIEQKLAERPLRAASAERP